MFKIQKIKAGRLVLHTENFGNITHPACLLIAGAMATARFWTDNFCLKLVSYGLFVIRYDHRDIGESSTVEWNLKPYDLFDLAKDAIAILDGYGIKQAHYIGHSMGGYICQAIGVDFPQRILSLSMISSGPIGATEETDIPLTDAEKKILQQTWELLLKPKNENSLEDHILSFMPVWRYLNGKIPLDEEMARSYTQDLLTRTGNKIQAGNNHELVMRELLATLQKRRGILKKIQSPAFVIHGENDPLALPRDGYALACAIENSHLDIVSEMGHMLFNRELEEKIVKLLIGHIKR